VVKDSFEQSVALGIGFDKLPLQAVTYAHQLISFGHNPMLLRDGWQGENELINVFAGFSNPCGKETCKRPKRRVRFET
jgi:hypothetical protein